MATLHVAFRVDNEAFRDERNAVNTEAVAQAIHGIADRISAGVVSGPVIDVNGNSVGRYNLTCSQRSL